MEIDNSPQSERKKRARLDGRERDAGRAERCARPCDGDATARRAGGAVMGRELTLCRERPGLQPESTVSRTGSWGAGFESRGESRPGLKARRTAAWDRTGRCRVVELWTTGWAWSTGTT
ncbi:hypothetical protein M0R45_009189 [Rubus argutus]|uniref:Uncharacterized protein n=1 Tax=Rubus argutus TaxID=59490 RepID=A0AAW1Y543_RUBAR